MLTPDQIDRFETDGYLVLPELFTPDEVALLKGEVPGIRAQSRPEVMKSDTGETRVALAVHRYNEVFARLLRHPKLVEPTRELLGGDVYCHQYKLIFKDPMGQLDFPWHQDFANWHDLDGMPEPRALNIALFLDDVTEFNGPVVFIPGSHKRGYVETKAAELDGLQETPLHSLDRETIEALVDARGLVAPKGKAGTAVMFHGCLAHASGPNISPWTRHIIYLTSNRVDNYIRKPTRPEYIAHRDFEPLVPFAPDCLEELMAQRKAASG